MARPSPAAVVAAILLPPLGIYLVRGLGPAFWVGVALTIFWWLPGIAFALVVQFAPHLLPPRLLAAGRGAPAA
ncbi:MAG: YqaE/Pmp3 family membrane protein [Sphingomonas fennica]